MTLSQLQLKQWDAVIKSVERALEIDDENYLAYYRLAGAYIGMSKYTKAQEAIKQQKKSMKKQTPKKKNKQMKR